MFGNDVPDYGKLKEDRRRDREDIRGLEQSFKLGIGNSLDKMLDVVTGNYRAPSLPGEPEKITAPIKGISGGRKKAVTAARHEDYEEEDESPRRGGGNDYRPASSSAGISRYAEVVSELERFRFAEDKDKRKRQMTAVVASIRTALQELIIKEVYANTKRAFGDDHIGQVFKINGGCKIVFVFGDQKIAVSARGAFLGEETVCVYKQGEKINAGVMRVLDDGETEDISSNYAISMERV